MAGGTGISGTGMIGELAGLLRPMLSALARRLPELVAGLALLLTALGGLALTGAAVHDVAIDRNRAVAAAEVLEGSTFGRTLIRFTAADGQTVVPERGVFYPRGLAPGAAIAVEYDITDPEVVRVAGRSALDGLPAVLLGVLGVWAVLGPLTLWLRMRRAGPPG
ncbi:MAG: DUF3592 domain-containing protein [Pseudonocardia sp.]